MGYTTDFSGQFDLSRKLTEDEASFLKMFAETRRMSRDPEKVLALKGKERNIKCLALLNRLGLELGPNAENYCGTGMCGQDHDPSIKEYNGSWGEEPTPFPSLWCQWVPTEDNMGLEWDDGEKFYEYVKWIEYLIEHFLTPWGIKVNGSVEWDGEERGDLGLIKVVDSVVTKSYGFISYGDGGE